jgi:hypothetical protein
MSQNFNVVRTIEWSKSVVSLQEGSIFAQTQTSDSGFSEGVVASSLHTRKIVLGC